MAEYTKLSALVNDEFTVEKSYGFQWKMWDEGSKRFVLSDKYEDGFRKVYTVVTDKGNLDLGAGQLGNLLESVYNKGESNIIGKTFSVKSNGKEGKDVRYYLKPVYGVKKDKVVEPEEGAFSLDDIPF